MMASLDEGYLKYELLMFSVGSNPVLKSKSITAYMADHQQTAAEVINQLRAEVEKKTKLTISAGIAPNRMLAKVRGSTPDKAIVDGEIDLLGQE